MELGVIDVLEGPPATTGSLSVEQQQKLAARCQASPGDVILFAADFPPAVNRTLDAMWTYLAENLRLTNKVKGICILSLDRQ
jgi:aspartyl-tRNA synthetase